MISVHIETNDETAAKDTLVSWQALDGISEQIHKICENLMHFRQYNGLPITLTLCR